MILSWPYRLAAAVALAGALWGAGALWATLRAERAAEAARMAAEAAALEVAVEQARAGVEIVWAWSTDVRTIRERGRTITERIPVYVTPEDDRACRLPGGFVRLLNDAAGAGVRGPADDLRAGAAAIADPADR